MIVLWIILGIIVVLALGLAASYNRFVSQRNLIHLHTRPQLHVAHVLAGAFEQAGGVGEGCAVEEADARVGGEGVDVGEGGVADAGGGHAVVQRLADVVAAGAHALEPGLDHQPERIGDVFEPGGTCADDRIGWRGRRGRVLISAFAAWSE